LVQVPKQPARRTEALPPIVLTPLAWNALRLGAVAAMAVYASRRRSTPKDADHEQTLDALPEGFATSTHRAEAERGMHAAGRFRRVLRFGQAAFEIEAAGLGRIRLRRAG
jgi:hypothetical protein